MNKRYIIPIVLAMLMVPAFMLAQQAVPRETTQTQTFGGNVVDFLVGSPCLVPVYHSNFIFPPEGGVVIRVGDQLFFVADYLAQCEGVAEQGEIISRNSGSTQTESSTNTNGGSVLNFLLGNSCLVPVYHTNFLFPSEGGVIIRSGDQMYFVPDYLDECAGFADQGDILRDSSDSQSEVTTDGRNGGGAVLNFLLGDPCLVPVYHSNFIFPSEGGEIVEIGGQLFFAKTYLEGCEI